MTVEHQKDSGQNSDIETSRPKPRTVLGFGAGFARPGDAAKNREAHSPRPSPNLMPESSEPIYSKSAGKTITPSQNGLVMIKCPITGTTLDSVSIGQVVLLHVSMLHPNPFNPRNTYESRAYQRTIEERADSIEEGGQLQPAIVSHIDNQWIVADGRSRWLAIELLMNSGRSDGYLRAEIHKEMSPKELYEVAFASNDERESQNDIDCAIGWRRVLDAGLYKDQDELANALNVSKTKISMALSFTSFPADIQDVLMEHAHIFSYNIMSDIRILRDKTTDEITKIYINQLINADIDGEGFTRKEALKLKDKLVANHIAGIPVDAVKRDRSTSTVLYSGIKHGLKFNARSHPNGKVSIEISGETAGLDLQEAIEAFAKMVETKKASS